MDNNKLHATALCHVLQASSLSKYQSDISYIWGELYRLNSNLFVLERILQFRSDLFLEPMKMNFFNLVTISLTHDSCLIVTKLVTDSGGDTLTLSKFHNYVEQNILPEIKCAFNESCGKVDFKKTIQIVQDKIEPLRDTNGLIIIWSL